MNGRYSKKQVSIGYFHIKLEKNHIFYTPATEENFIMKYDLVIKAGRVIDFAQGLDRLMDIGISDGKIVTLAPDLDRTQAQTHLDAKGLLVTPGLIDFHAHALFLSGMGMGSDLDDLCRMTGVTTFVDGGSAGAATFPVFKEQFIDSCQTRIRAFLHISSIGLADLEVGESTYLDLHDPERAADAARKYPQWIMGFKVREQIAVVGTNRLAPGNISTCAVSL